ncbi:hypothetical protein Tco_0928037 [Tanacetum coccineum]
MVILWMLINWSRSSANFGIGSPADSIAYTRLILIFRSCRWCVLLGWDDAESGRMVESKNHSPQQPPQATLTNAPRGFDTVGLQRGERKLNLHQGKETEQRGPVGLSIVKSEWVPPLIRRLESEGRAQSHSSKTQRDEKRKTETRNQSRNIQQKLIWQNKKSSSA